MNVDTSSATATVSSTTSSNSVKTTSSTASNNDLTTNNDFSKELEKASSSNDSEINTETKADFQAETKTESQVESQVETKAETKATEKTETTYKTSTENKTEKSYQYETYNAENKTISDTNSQNQNMNQNQQNQQNQNSQTAEAIFQMQQEYLQGSVNISDTTYNTSLNTSDILTQNIQALVNTKDEITAQSLKSSTPSSLDYSSIQMSDEDALFFADLVQNTDMTMQSITSQIQNNITNNVEGIEQKVKVSATLMNTIQEGMKTNQPFRIDFDKDVSVILRIDRDGSVSANFIPGDKAVEQYLKNNIGFLRQRFDEENLSYKDLSYSQSRNQNRERNNQERKDKEKD